MEDDTKNRAVAVRAEVLPEQVQAAAQIPVRKSNDFQAEIQAMIASAGTLDLSEAQQKILFGPVREEDVEIRPDGLVYLPWMEYVVRLREAFGGQWAVIPQGMPRMENNLILWGFYLVVQGKLMAYAVGEQAYSPTNARMSYGDAMEGAKSNALMRLCKGLGISLELWRPSYVRAWKRKWAESYQQQGRTLWRKLERPRENPPDVKADLGSAFDAAPSEPTPEAPTQPPTPPAANGKDKQHRIEIGTKLIEMVGKDNAPAKLESLSQFEADGSLVPGVKTIHALSEKRVNVVLGKVRKEYAEWLGAKANANIGAVLDKLGVKGKARDRQIGVWIEEAGGVAEAPVSDQAEDVLKKLVQKGGDANAPAS